MRTSMKGSPGLHDVSKRVQNTLQADSPVVGILVTEKISNQKQRQPSMNKIETRGWRGTDVKGKRVEVYVNEGGGGLYKEMWKGIGEYGKGLQEGRTRRGRKIVRSARSNDSLYMRSFQLRQ